MSRINPYQLGLDKNPANFVALSPLSYIDRGARVYPDRAAIIFRDDQGNKTTLAFEVCHRKRTGGGSRRQS